MKTLSRVALALSLCTALVAGPALAETVKQEKAEHPRIAKAIHELEDAIKYMEEAPHDFGGKKAAALESSRKALADLREALAFRAAADTKKGK